MCGLFSLVCGFRGLTGRRGAGIWAGQASSVETTKTLKGG